MGSSQYENEQKSVKDLLQYSFLIPKYQRGYRWTKFNVSQLLDDIMEALDSNKEYILHVLVLYSSRNLKEERQIIIDGQQRITTIFLIIACINRLLSDEKKENLKIEFESRTKSKDFMDYLNRLSMDTNSPQKEESFKWKSVWSEYSGMKDEQIKENIDFRYMFQAYETIYEKISQKDKKDIETLKEYIFEKCKFICPQVKLSAEVGEGQSMFNKLNAGKIYLTNSELIKSEYLNPKYYDNQFESKVLLISKAWNEIEKALQKPDFWAFIPHEHQYGQWNQESKSLEQRNRFLPRIDEIFQLYLLDGYQDKEDIYEEDFEKYGNSNYFIYEKIKEEIEEDAQRENFDIEEKWGSVEILFSKIRELYESDGRSTGYRLPVSKDDKNCENGVNSYNLYNFIAYSIYMHAIIQGKSDLEIGRFMVGLLRKDRDKRNKLLVEKIKEGFFDIYFNKDEREKNAGEFDKEKIKGALEKLKYRKEDEENNEKIKNVILLFNTILLQKNPALSHRYDFLNYGYWTIEHIYSQKEKKLTYDTSEIDKIRDAIAKNEKKINKIDNKFKDIIENIEVKSKQSEEDKRKAKEQIESDRQKQKKPYEEKNEKYNKKLEREICELPIKRREIIDSLLEYMDSEQDEKVSEETLNTLKEICSLMDVVEKLKEGEGGTDKEPESAVKNFSEKHKNEILNSFMKKIEEKKYSNEDSFIDDIMKIFRLSSDPDSALDNDLKAQYSEYRKWEEKEGGSHPEVDRCKKGIECKLGELYEDRYWKSVENRKAAYQEAIEKYFKETHNQKFGSNDLGNLALLRGKENREGANEYLYKKEMISKLISKGTAIPYSTLLVFTDFYQDIRRLRSGERWQWLLRSRKKYFDHILDVLCEFLEIEQQKGGTLK